MIQFIVFSKDRPLQLHGYLTSLFKQWRGDVGVTVLVRSEPPYAKAYQAIEEEFFYDVPRVEFVLESDFSTDLRAILNRNTDFVCFGCDDAVFTAPVDTKAIEAAFKDSALLGVSFRLGRTITRGMFGGEMPQPPFIPAVTLNEFDEQPTGPSLLWDVRKAPPETDWAYPWEVIGTVYDGNYARRMVEGLTFTSPNTLEHQGSMHWQAGPRRMMRAYPTPRLVLPAVNVVQTDFPNGIVGEAPLTPEYLLDLWQKGVRLDVDEFARQAPKLDTWRIGNLWLTRAK